MIKPINVTFKAVYRSNTRNANEYQLEIMEDIKEKFSSKNYRNSEGLTPVERYEKQDIDLLLKPGFGNAVGIIAVTNMKQGNLKRAPKYNVLSYIGTYGPSHEFSPDDVDKKLNKDNNDISFLSIIGILFAGIISKAKKYISIKLKSLH